MGCALSWGEQLPGRALVIAKCIVVIATLGLVSGAADAAFFNSNHDAADLVAPAASFLFAGVDWSQEIGGESIRGQLKGQLTCHGGVADCAKSSCSGETTPEPLSVDLCVQFWVGAECLGKASGNRAPPLMGHPTH